MELILKEDVINLGYKDDIVKVKDGYGRNYLIPTGKAVIATESAKKVLAENLRQRAHKLAKIKADAEALAAKLEGVSLTIATKVSATGAIYGSVGAIQIAEELAKLGFEIDRKIIAVDAAKDILFSLDPRLRSQELLMFCSQDFADKYNEAYLMTHGGIPYNTQYNHTTVEGSNGRLKLVPLYNKADSKFIHICPKSNMLVGYDQMGDIESVMVKEYGPFILTYIATMFFGVQFESIDKRRFKVIELV